MQKPRLRRREKKTPHARTERVKGDTRPDTEERNSEREPCLLYVALFVISRSNVRFVSISPPDKISLVFIMFKLLTAH